MKYNIGMICALFILCDLVALKDDVGGSKTEVNKGEEEVVREDITPKKMGLSKKDLYKYGFQVKRGEQIEGVKRILQINDYGKQFKMVKLLLEKMFIVMSNAKITVIESGYIPGGEFPDDQDKLDALGQVFENVAMFGDLVLRLPDITHKLYDGNKEWKLTITWAFLLANESDIFDGANRKLLNLMGQELDIIPREADYLNPYKEVTIKKEKEQKAKEEKKRKSEKEKKEREKRNKSKKRKGPRLGGGRTRHDL